jgi:chemotaxis protein MotB
MARLRNGKRNGGEERGPSHERWLVSYADMITLLMALFVILWSIATLNTEKFEALSQSLRAAFSGRILPGGESVVQPGARRSGEDVPAAEPPVPAIVPPVEGAQDDGQRSDAAEREREELAELKRKIDEWVRMHGLTREVETRIAQRGLVVRILTDKILFDSGSAELKPEADELLDALSRLLKTQVRNPIQVEGNTDNVPISGRYPSNWELSTARATTVVRDLIRRGVWSGRLSAAGYADQHPVASNATEAGRRRNRRVEIVVLRKNAGGQGGRDVTHEGTGS